MKRITIVFCVLFFSVFILEAQEKTKTDSVANPNGPKITFDNVVHDYGTIMKGSNGDCEFTFTNTGNEPLILSNARSS